ncbi:hypothetical protein SUGI_1032960 [Cryptomeria japonica]|nr:hypothetical protein SUGI_1032960 [Cryptomeria japonica]
MLKLQILVYLDLIDRLGDEYTVSIYVGYHGHIAPEYVERLRIDEKSDVYSFGVVMLELVSGRKATGEMEYGKGADIVGWIHKNNLDGRGGERSAG